MFSKFKKYIESENLFNEEDKILATVSGGIDSVVMVELLSQLKCKFSIAHCNFQLRGNESDMDMEFVKRLANLHKVPFHVKKFDTNTFVLENKVSTQMAARELRYKWFDELKIEYEYNYIATAHHANDQLETIIFNLVKGTGIEGLRGIKSKSNNIIRPLLFASKQSIIEFANQSGLKWREDKSNVSNKYSRNLIRNKVVPILKQINPSIEEGINETTKKLSSVENIFFKNILELESKCIRKTSSNNIEIDINRFNSVIRDNRASILYYLIKKYRFSFSQCKDITDSIRGTISGKQFISNTHRLLLDRNKLIIENLKEHELQPYIIKEDLLDINHNKLNVSFKRYNRNRKELRFSDRIGLFDLKKIVFPLKLRQWQEGDKIKPLGMKGKNKKLSDILIDKKVSLFEKESVYVLECGSGELIWVLGFVVSEVFKIDVATEEVLEVVVSVW